MPEPMTDAILDVMRDYPIARQTPRHGAHSVHAMLGEVRRQAEIWLHDAVGEPQASTQWRTRASTGRGRAWANVCWVSVMRSSETHTAQDGRYIAWLFDAEGRHVVLALVWGTARYRRELEGADVAGGLRQRRARGAAEIAASLPEGVFEVDEDVDLGAGTQLARDYERSCLVWRRYQAAQDLQAMRSDFDALLEVYVALCENASTTTW